jgi:hypothetical protein
VVALAAGRQSGGDCVLALGADLGARQPRRLLGLWRGAHHATAAAARRHHLLVLWLLLLMMLLLLLLGMLILGMLMLPMLLMLLMLLLQLVVLRGLTAVMSVSTAVQRSRQKML